MLSPLGFQSKESKTLRIPHICKNTVHFYVCKYTHVRTYIQTQMHTTTQTCTHEHTHTHILKDIPHIQTHCTHNHMNSYTHAHICTNTLSNACIQAHTPSLPFFSAQPQNRFRNTYVVFYAINSYAHSRTLYIYI